MSIRGVLPLFLNLQREVGTRTSLSGEGSGGDNVDGVNENLMIFDTTPPLENAALLTESHDIRGNDLITVEGFGEELQQLVSLRGGIFYHYHRHLLLSLFLYLLNRK